MIQNAPHKKSSFSLAIDVMGGEAAPNAPLIAANNISKKNPFVHFHLYGDEKKITPLLEGLRHLKRKSIIFHTEEKVSDHDKPSVSLRQGKNSSMRLAIDALFRKEVSAVISSGNTGALMAHAKIVLKTLPGIDRPAITSLIPTKKNSSVMLDLGANVECTAHHLFQFSLMGSAFARAVLNVKHPKVALLNIGEEEMKGNEIIKAAAASLRNNTMPFDFVGFVEGDDLLEGKVDVIVTDGFTGNVALKTAEGTARLFGELLKKAIKKSIFTLLGGMLLRSSLKSVFQKMDPRVCNGAMLLGLNGIVVKSHGSSDHIAFAHAIEVAIKLVHHHVNDQIAKELEELDLHASCQ